MALGEAKVKIGATLAPLKTALAQARKLTTTALTRMGSGIVRGMTNVVRRAMSSLIRSVKMAAAAIIASMVYIGVTSAKMAADVEESENLFVVSMGSMADATRKWSESVSNALGLNQYEVRKMVSTFNVMLNSMGIAPQKAAAMSQSLTQLAYDMASFFNLKPDIAFQKLQAGITGEVEPLKRLGILVNENTIKNYALTTGMIRQGEVMNDQQKIFARFNTIMEQTSKAQGDMARTLDSTQNVSRRFLTVLDKIRITIGYQLNPAITQIKSDMSNWLQDSEPKIKSWATEVGKSMKEAWGWFKDVATLLQNPVTRDEGIQRIGEAVGGVVKTAIDKLKEPAIELGKIMAHAFVESVKAAADEIFGKEKVKEEVTRGKATIVGAVVGAVAGAPLGPVGVVGGAITGAGVGRGMGGLKNYSEIEAQRAANRRNAGYQDAMQTGYADYIGAIRENTNELRKQNMVR